MTQLRVRDALLALLAHGPAHGYQLKVDYERLTGAGPINVGQIYSTLDRLQRDGLVERDDTADDDRRVPYHLTDAGRAEAMSWLLDARELPLNGRSVVAGKVLLATTSYLNETRDTTTPIRRQTSSSQPVTPTKMVPCWVSQVS